MPVDEAEAMFKLCHRPLIEKTRYEIPYQGLVWHVDEFGGLDGLILAEVELKLPDQSLDLPPWVNREVTQDERFRNSRLVDNPQDQTTNERECSGRAG